MALAAPFHNRRHELAAIQRAIASDRPELVILYGRRGAGKSRLLLEALTGQHVFWYEATLRVTADQLEDLAAAMRAYAPGIVVGRLESVQQALEALADLAARTSERPAIWVVDELPWLDQAIPGVATTLKEWWDRRIRGRLRNVKLFLAGSLVGWMRAQTLDEGGPLHNRRTRQFHLGPLDYLDAARFYVGYSPPAKIEAYAVFGGLPSYLAELRAEDDLWTNVKELMLDPTARLAEEPEWYRYGDLRGDAVYASMLRAIASGHRRPSDIARAVGRHSASEVLFQLDRLREIGLVVRETPVHERQADRSSRALYRLADHYVAFWYRYVDRMRHLTASHRPDLALAEIRGSFAAYVAAPPFEDVCRQFVSRAAATGHLPAELVGASVGSWWTGRGRGPADSSASGTGPRQTASIASDATPPSGTEGDVTSDEAAGQSDELDVVAMRDGRCILVGECKWSVSSVGMRDLAGLAAALRRAAELLQGSEQPWRALFSRSGFDQRLRDHARDPAQRLLLIEPGDLYGVSESAVEYSTTSNL